MQITQTQYMNYSNYFCKECYITQLNKGDVVRNYYTHGKLIVAGLCYLCAMIIPINLQIAKEQNSENSGSFANFNLNNNYFSLLNLPIQFFLNQKLLEANFFMRMKIFHPDRTINLNDNIREIAVKNATLYNTAFFVLKNDLERANHLLEIYKINWSQEIKNTANLTAYKELLFASFKQNEELSALITQIENILKIVKAQNSIISFANINDIANSELNNIKRILNNIVIEQEKKIQINLNKFAEEHSAYHQKVMQNFLLSPDVTLGFLYQNNIDIDNADFLRNNLLITYATMFFANQYKNKIQKILSAPQEVTTHLL